MGHFQRVCKSVLRNVFVMTNNTNDDCWQDNKVLTTSLTMLPENLNYTTVTSEINGLEVDWLLDTGASGNFMSEDTA